MFIKKKREIKKDRNGKKREPSKRRVYRKKPCKFCLDKVVMIDHLDYQRFQKFLTERGKIIPSRISGTCAVHQRQLARAVKRGRIAAILPFVAE